MPSGPGCRYQVPPPTFSDSPSASPFHAPPSSTPPRPDTSRASPPAAPTAHRATPDIPRSSLPASGSQSPPAPPWPSKLARARRLERPSRFVKVSLDLGSARPLNRRRASRLHKGSFSVPLRLFVAGVPRISLRHNGEATRRRGSSAPLERLAWTLNGCVTESATQKNAGNRDYATAGARKGVWVGHDPGGHAHAAGSVSQRFRHAPALNTVSGPLRCITWRRRGGEGVAFFPGAGPRKRNSPAGGPRVIHANE
jgi:hypothetical protein